MEPNDYKMMLPSIGAQLDSVLQQLCCLASAREVSLEPAKPDLETRIATLEKKVCCLESQTDM